MIKVTHIFTATFWAYAAERAIKTAAQSALGVLTAELVLDRGSWEEALIVVGVATVASVLTSVQTAPPAYSVSGDPAAVFEAQADLRKPLPGE